MNVQLLLILAISVPLFSGCRRDPHMQVYVDNLNAEKRLLEDTLYDLQYDYESKAAEVEKLREELEDLRAGDVGGRSSSGRGAGGAESGGSRRDLFPDIPDLKPPAVQEGRRSESSEGDDAPTIEIQPDVEDLEPPKIDLGEGDEPLSAAPLPLDQQITSLYLNPAHTGGLRQDRKPGDEGILVVFEPRNRDNDFVPLAGRVSAVLLDPESRQRVARWELSEEQVETALQKARAGHGIELAMPWEDEPPTKSRLHLFVRYWLPDGQTVQADRELTIAANGRVASRWTPRTEQRPDPPTRRVDVAETSEASTTAVPNQSGRSAGQSEVAAEQAQLPPWRPYR